MGLRISAAVLLVGLWQPAQAATATLTLHAQVLLQSPRASLGELAQVESDDGALRRQLLSLVVGPAVRAGSAELLQGQALMAELRAQPGLQGHQLRLAGASAVRLLQTEQWIKGAALGQAAEAALRAQFGAQYERMEVTPLGPIADLPVARGAVTLRPAALLVPLRTRSMLWIDVLVDGQLYRRAAVALEVRAWRTVLVAQHAMAGGTLLGNADLRREQQEVLSLRAAPYGTQLPAGGRLRMPVAAGEVLVETAVAMAGTVMRGDRLLLRAGGAGLQVERPAVAQQEGMPGQRIRVLPDAGSDPVVGIALGGGIVEAL